MIGQYVKYINKDILRMICVDYVFVIVILIFGVWHIDIGVA